jgi:hypothetical protein
MPLTDLKIKNLKSKDKPYKVSDFDGLYVLVNPNGTRLWRVKYRLHWKEGLLSLGAYPAITLRQARQMRDEARAQVAVEIDPSEVKRENAALIKQKHANTFENVAENYLNKITIEGRTDVTLRKISSFLAMAIADFGQKPIAELSAATILKTLKKVEAKGLYETAKRLRSTVGAVFRYAIANGLAENDPTYPLRDALIRHKVKSRAAITDKIKLGGLLREIGGYR